jgi:hypothetical protein
MRYLTESEEREGLVLLLLVQLAGNRVVWLLPEELRAGGEEPRAQGISRGAVGRWDEATRREGELAREDLGNLWDRAGTHQDQRPQRQWEDQRQLLQEGEERPQPSCSADRGSEERSESHSV